jgi:hypothetical protein
MNRLTMAATAAAMSFGLVLGAWASPPSVRQMAKVNILAHRLHQAAQLSCSVVRSGALQLTRRETDQLNRLVALEGLAGRFHRSAEENFVQPGRTEAGFQELLRAYSEALEGLDWLRGIRGAAAAFDDVRLTMDELVVYYGGYPEWYAAKYPAP